MNMITKINNTISTEPNSANDEECAGACANNAIGAIANEINVIFSFYIDFIFLNLFGD